MQRYQQWQLTLAILALALSTLAAVIGHMVMTERRLATLEVRLAQCVGARLLDAQQ